MLLKQCKCGAFIYQQQQYCDNCMKEFKTSESKRRQEYKQSKYMTDEVYRKRMQFYKTKEWTSLRLRVLSNCNGIDVYQLIMNDEVVHGKLIHHIETIKDNDKRKLDINNLICVSDKTHDYIHRIYDKSEKDKAEMQQLLFWCLNEYRRKYGM